MVAVASANSTRLTFDNAWVRAPIAGQTVTAGYCDITNRGESPVTVTGFEGPVLVAMHETRHEDGMVRMRPLARLTIAPQETLSLAPGGKHLMLFGVTAKSSYLSLRAVFDDGETQAVRFRVGSQ